MTAQFRIVRVATGWVGFVASSRGLRRVYLPEKSKLDARRRIIADEPTAQETPELLPDFTAELTDYFAGKPVDFSTEFDWAGRSLFDQRVWLACAKVAYGQRASYADLARAVGKPRAARAIGAAMAHNPCPIVIPCHRILRSDGSLGGYSGPGGLQTKRELLDMESRAAGGSRKPRQLAAVVQSRIGYRDRPDN